MLGRRALATIGLVAFTVVSTQAAGPVKDNDHLAAVWVAESKGVLKLAASDGRTLCELPGRNGAEAVAVDEQGAVLWTYGDDHLRAYSFACAPLSDTRVDLHDREALLAIHQGDGSVWLGAEHRLLHVDALGKVKKQLNLRDNLRALAVDAKRARVWYAGEHSIIQLSEEGALVKETRLPGHSEVRGMALDPTTGALWIANEHAVERLDTPALSVPFRHAERLSADHVGGLWIASDRSLLHVTADGNVTASFEPFGFRWHSGGRIDAMQADLADNSVWVAGHQALAQYDTAGNLLRRFDDALPADPRRHHHHHEFGDHVRALALYSDRLPPDLTVTSPAAGAYVNTARPEFKLAYSDDGIGVDTTTLKATTDGTELTLTCEFEEQAATCHPASPLAEGPVTVTFTIKDYAGNTSEAAAHSFTVDTHPPVITIGSPSDRAYTNQATVTVTARLNEGASVTLNGESVFLTPDNSFSAERSLTEGANTFTISAEDNAGNRASIAVTVHLDTVVPTVPNIGSIAIVVNGDGTVVITGAAGSVEGSATVLVRNKRTGEVVTALANADGSFTLRLRGETGDTFEVIVQDEAQNRSDPVDLITGTRIPPDPATVAPPLNSKGIVSMYNALTFLFSGPNPIQEGVLPGAIEAKRIAVLIGTVHDRDGGPLQGVEITIKDHPEFGRTFSRIDGAFDMAVNGGGYVTVQYQREGYLPVQRHLKVDWTEWGSLPDVVMVKLDAWVSPIDLGNGASFQVASGSLMHDANGDRQATVMFPPGTQAQMVLEDGTSQPLTTLHVRATEYTVGENGPKTMPGDLPPYSGYTYAVELSVDEAVSAGAREVRFSQPLPLYVDNFLHFPVGTAVPIGYYDRTRAAWIPSPNGRVIQILSVTNGLAELDVNGTGKAASDTELDALGITPLERAQLADRYAPGKSLWRSPITHFTPWDCNWPYGPPPDSTPPPSPPQDTDKEDKPDTECGSIIECQNQVLGERIRIAGTPYTLNYRSDRTPGYTPRRAIAIPLSGNTVPASLTKILLQVNIAGQSYSRTFDPRPGLVHEFVWDGNDRYDRQISGTHVAHIMVGYAYPAVYYKPADFDNSFGSAGSSPITSDRRSGEIVIWQRFTRALEFSPPTLNAVGGWYIDEIHTYDAQSQAVHRGDGSRYHSQSVAEVINTVAGTSSDCCMRPIDGGSATAATFQTISSIAAGPDGAFYLSEMQGHRIWLVKPDGKLVRIAGTGAAGFSGDGGLAVDAQLGSPEALAVAPDGTLYVADGYRVRKIDRNGIISTVAGTGDWGSDGLGGPALKADILPSALAIGPDGSIYIGERNNHRVTRVGLDGVIVKVAGMFYTQPLGDGGPAVNASLYYPHDIALGPDGSLYIADTNHHRIRRVDLSGTIRTVVGTGSRGFTGDGGKATSARINNPTGISVDRDGSLFFADVGNHRIRRVAPDGTIKTIAGNGTSGFAGDTQFALAAEFDWSGGAWQGDLGLRNEKKLLVIDGYRVRQVWLPVPDDQTYVSSQSGDELYAFDTDGRHLRTLDSISGATKHTFHYVNGSLSRIEDASGNITTIERDASGVPLAIVSPYGQRTDLALDQSGYIASVSNPASERYRMEYAENGLLLNFSTPRGSKSLMTYDMEGHLLTDRNAVGGGWTLTRSQRANGYEAGMTSTEGRTTRFQVDYPPSGGKLRTRINPDATRTVVAELPNGNVTNTSSDGTVTTQQYGADPRFGMLSAYVTNKTVTTPTGRTLTINSWRMGPNDRGGAFPVDAAFAVNETINDGPTAQTSYNAETRTWTVLTPEGRSNRLEMDPLNRPISAQTGTLSGIQLTYDVHGRIAGATRGEASEARATTLAYDSLGNLERMTDPLNRTVGFEHDLAGRVTKQTFPDGRTIEYGYDLNGKLTRLIPPGRTAHLFEYTAVDQEQSYAPPTLDGVDTITRYTYNLDKQLTRIERPDGKVVGIDYYEPSGKIKAVNFSRGQIGYSYFPTTGKLASITAPGQSLTYTWDGFLPLSETATGEVSGTVSRTYDNNFWLKSIAINGEAVEYEYDNDGLVTKAGEMTITRDPQNGFITDTTLGVVTTHREYTNFGELKSEVAKVNDNPVFATSYVRDALGRITEKTETIEGVTTTYGYHYDEAGRLDEVKTNGTATARYQYDENGNRLSKWTPDGEETGTYDAQDRMVTYGGASYEYTVNGELKSRTESGATINYAYDEIGNLTQVKLSGSAVIDYVIDGRNRRVGKKVGGMLVQAFLYQDGLEPVAELDGNGNVVARFIYGSKTHVPDLLMKGGKLYRIVSDHLGSPRQVVDTINGDVVQRIEYDEFGNVVLDTNPGFQPFGFAGGIYDQHALLTRFGARDYDARTGRWLLKDPIRFSGGDANIYSYVHDDPLNAVDPSGHDGFPLDPGFGTSYFGQPPASDPIGFWPAIEGGGDALKCTLTCVAGKKIDSAIPDMAVEKGAKDIGDAIKDGAGAVAKACAKSVNRLNDAVDAYSCLVDCGILGK